MNTQQQKLIKAEILDYNYDRSDYDTLNAGDQAVNADIVATITDKDNKERELLLQAASYDYNCTSFLLRVYSVDCVEIDNNNFSLSNKIKQKLQKKLEKYIRKNYDVEDYAGVNTNSVKIYAK